MTEYSASMGSSIPIFCCLTVFTGLNSAAALAVVPQIQVSRPDLAVDMQRTHGQQLYTNEQIRNGSSSVNDRE
jgi:hypothetical protein